MPQRTRDSGTAILPLVPQDRGHAAVDTVKALVDYVFRKEGVRKVYLHTLTRNARAQKCFQKCGFVEDGRVTRAGYDFIHMEMKRPTKYLGNDRSQTATGPGDPSSRV